MFRTILLVTGLFISPLGFTEEVKNWDEESKAREFIAASHARQQPSASVEEINALLALIADEFRDVHVMANNYTYTDKSVLKKDMKAKLQDKIHYLYTDINQIVVGQNVAVVHYTERAKVKPFHLDRVIEHRSKSIVLLEFDESGLIKSIRRYRG